MASSTFSIANEEGQKALTIARQPLTSEQYYGSWHYCSACSNVALQDCRKSVILCQQHQTAAAQHDSKCARMLFTASAMANFLPEDSLTQP